MKDLPDLKQLTDEAKDALIVSLWEELKKLRHKKPKKTSKNSSLPPLKASKLRFNAMKKRLKANGKQALVEREAVVR